MRLYMYVYYYSNIYYAYNLYSNITKFPPITSGYIHKTSLRYLKALKNYRTKY